jgi:signal transduction histidine kinase
MLMMLAVGFLIWFFVGRRALKRIDSVSRSTERILAGDHSERLPVMGSNDEFDRLSRRMNAMLDRITVLDSGLKSVSDSIAHDLKTPLTRIRNKADGVLRADADDTEQVVALGEIIEEADQLIKVFNALLMISRVEAGSQVAELTPIDISALIADIAELYEPLAEEEGFAFTVKTESDLMVQGNRELLSQAVSNLIDNAFKYADGGEQNGKQIELRLYREKASVVVAVSDKGPGIPPQDYERAKERFSRLDESRTKPGSGLGLALVDAIAKFHSGQLEMSDAEPGLLVCIVLPALEK